MRNVFLVAAAVLVAALTAGNASANVMFSDSFTGSASPDWTNTGAAVYTGNVADFNGSSSRDYLRTVDADYGKADFVATVDLYNPSSTNAYCYPFFGIGTGMPDSANWGEPTAQSAVTYLFANSAITAGAVKNEGGALSYYSADGPGPNEWVRVQLSWVASSGTATFSVDTNLDGIYDSSVSVTNTALINGTSRIFVGGSDHALADNFSVTSIPEPSGLVLLATGVIGLLAYAWRKRS